MRLLKLLLLLNVLLIVNKQALSIYELNSNCRDFDIISECNTTGNVGSYYLDIVVSGSISQFTINGTTYSGNVFNHFESGVFIMDVQGNPAVFITNVVGSGSITFQNMRLYSDFGGSSLICTDNNIFTKYFGNVRPNNVADMCPGDVKNLTGSPSGGTWSIVSGGGSLIGNTYTAPAVTGFGNSITVVLNYFYTDGFSCTVDDDISFTVTSTDPPIVTGGNDICQGTTNTFSSQALGGSYTILSGPGSISGNVYTAPATVASVTTVTVRHNGYLASTACGYPGPVDFSFDVFPPTSTNTTGNSSALCETDVRNLVATPIGGTWSLTSGSGSLTGSAYTPAVTGSSYSVVVTYSFTNAGGCITNNTTGFTVNPAPDAGTLSGNQNICDGSNTTFSTTGSGGSWTSSNTGIATVNTSGVVTGQSAGTATISYTVPASGGCSSATATRTVTVTAPPSAGTLSGNQTICDGSTTTFSSTQAGGSWSSSNTGVATVNGSGVVTGQSAGTATITYTVTGTGGCSNATATRTVTVTAPPSAGTLSGNQSICDGSTTTFSSTQAGGSWSSSNTGIATANASSGVITGQSAGTATITYTVTGTGGCPNATATRTVTVTAPPSAGTLSGNQSICNGSTTTFSSTQAGGSWSSSNTGIATVNASSGVVTGQSAGTATITYTVTGTGGCSNATATRTVTVTAPPSAGTLSGNQTICDGLTTTFSSTQAGGSWSSSNTGVATVNASSGVVTGQSGGTATITYTVTGTGGCPNATATRTVTVNSNPTVTVPSGGNVCVGETLNLTPSTGGTWSSSDGTVATITNGGVVTGVDAGTADMTFTNTTTGCSSTVSAGTITVNPLPTFTVSTADPSSCGATDGTITISGLNASTGYEVSTGSGALSPVTSDPSGEIVLTFGAGSYSPIEVSWNGCSTIDNGTYDLNDPSSPSITVPNGGQLCEGETLNLTPSTGGTWTSNDPSVAIIDNAGLLSGVSAGTVTVTYTETATGCSSLASAGSITVNPIPTVTVPNGGNVCEGATLSLTPSTGGTWSSSDPSVATVTNGGIVTGVTVGTAEMTFTNTTTGCSSVASTGTITVNESPTIIVPVGNAICVGSTLDLAPTTGGTWSSSDPTVATITNGGVVTGVDQGTADMVFTSTTTGCSSIASTGTIIVNTTPTLTIGAIDCNEPTSSYSVGYTTTTGATVTSDIGTVTSTAVTNVPNNETVIITATIAGCPSVSETVSTDECEEIVIDISNGVSPNNDGMNDFFEITSLEAYPENSLSIYNRWGDKVFQSSPYENEWVGQNNVGGIGGEELPAGTYFYILELGEDEEPMKGYIELKK